MKIPVEWLKQYVDTNKSPREIANTFTAIGLMLDKPLAPYENGTYRTDVLDLEHRMDRSDWLAIIGCARDFAAYEKTELKFPEIYESKGKELKEEEKVKIGVECTDLVYRFNTRVFKNIKVQQSPKWLSDRLISYGIPSINNIVDITNYVMVELGQPMHAQDLKKMEKREIIIRRAKQGETIKTLLGETISLDENAFVLTQNGKPTVLGGIVGGSSTGIDNTTTEIVLDAGNYNQTNIRKSSRRFKIANETVLRYDKFLHPHLCEVAIKRATKLILEIAGGEYYDNVDWYPNKWELKKMTLRYSRVKKIGGVDIEPEFIKKTLTRIGYNILAENTEKLSLEIPYFRTDVEVEDDIVADVLRIYGYINIAPAPINSAPPKEITPEIYKFEDKIRDALVNLGTHEHITEPLVEANPQQKQQIILENAQSSQKNALRIELASGLNYIAENYNKHKINEGTLFEIGKIYTVGVNKNSYENYKETRVTEVLVFNKNNDPNELAIKTKQILDGVLKHLGYSKYDLVENNNGAEIILEKSVCGLLKFNGFTLYNEDLLLIKKNATTRVKVDFEDMDKNEISIEVEPSIRMGKVINELQNKFHSIENINVVKQDLQLTPGKKAYLLTITSKKTNTSQLTELRNVLSNITGITLR